MSTGIYAQPGNRTRSSARAAKQDEFYTQLADIANELKHYKPHLKGKVVLCNGVQTDRLRHLPHFDAEVHSLAQGRLTWASYPSSPASKPRPMFPGSSCQP